MLVLTAVTLITLDARASGGGVTGHLRARARDAFAPVQDATRAVLRPVGDFFSGVLHYGDVKKENARLRDQLAQVQGRDLQAAEAQREAQLVLEQQHLDFVGAIPTVAARVVGNTASNFEVSVQIDRGTDAGVGVGMPVVAGAGLVGRVAAVSARRATVLLETDPSFSVGVRLPSADAGVAAGTGRHHTLRVDLVDPGIKINPGEVVFTSGLQLERFPPGIPVGRVHSVHQVPGALQQDVTLDPMVDLPRLQFVKVLQWSPQ